VGLFDVDAHRFTVFCWNAALEFFNELYSGWLPNRLPELFPNRARSTGAGVGINFGRYPTTTTTILVSNWLLQSVVSDYALPPAND
jgi:hypothetical protein